MALLLKNNVIYLHIPKSGGNWLTKLLRDNDCIITSIEHKHSTYDLVAGFLRGCIFKKKITEDFSKYRFMTVIRNPLKWYESWFKYQNSRNFRSWGGIGNIHNWHIMSSINNVNSLDFNEFMSEINHRSPGFVTSLYSSYTANSNAYILKNETLRNDLSFLNKKLKLGIDEQEIFKSEEYGVSPKMDLTWDQQIFEETVSYELGCFKLHNYHWNNIVNVS